jgi:hypothetical protein
MATLLDDRLRFAMAIAMPLPSGPRRGVSALGRGLAPIPPPNREDKTIQHTVDQAPGATPRTLAGIIEGARGPSGHRAAIWARGMGRYTAGAGRRRASFAPLTACFTLGYTQKTSITPVLSRSGRCLGWWLLCSWRPRRLVRGYWVEPLAT